MFSRIIFNYKKVMPALTGIIKDLTVSILKIRGALGIFIRLLAGQNFHDKKIAPPSGGAIFKIKNETKNYPVPQSA
jgi:hypothetical protein